MKESLSDPGYGRTNWRRFAVAIGVPSAVAAGLVVALANGALAASFTVSGSSFKLSASELKGNGFTQYADQLDNAKGPYISAMSGIHDAQLWDLCQTVKSETPLGDIVMRIDAGQGGNAVTAQNLLIGMDDLQGNATFGDIQIGLDASTLNADGASSHGAVGSFGQQSKTIDIFSLRQTATYTSAGQFTLNGMRLHLYTGSDADSHECFQ